MMFVVDIYDKRVYSLCINRDLNVPKISRLNHFLLAFISVELFIVDIFDKILRFSHAGRQTAAGAED